MAMDQRIAKFSGHRVQDKHGSKSEDKMLGLPDHLLQDGLLGRHLEKNALVKDFVMLQKRKRTEIRKQNVNFGCLIQSKQA